MKKTFMLFGALMLMLNVATAQNCPFRIRTEVASPDFDTLKKYFCNKLII